MQPNTAPPGLTGGVALELQELQGTNLLFCRQAAWKESSLWMKMRAELTQKVGVQDTFLARGQFDQNVASPISLEWLIPEVFWTTYPSLW